MVEVYLRREGEEMLKAEKGSMNREKKRRLEKKFKIEQNRTEQNRIE